MHIPCLSIPNRMYFPYYFSSCKLFWSKSQDYREDFTVLRETWYNCSRITLFIRKLGMFIYFFYIKVNRIAAKKKSFNKNVTFQSPNIIEIKEYRWKGSCEGVTDINRVPIPADPGLKKICYPSSAILAFSIQLLSGCRVFQRFRGYNQYYSSIKPKKAFLRIC